MEISRDCCLPMLIIFSSFCIVPLNCQNTTAAGILDLQTTLGKIFRTCISMAIEDFYSKNSYDTMIVPHFRDSSSDVVTAASAAIDLLKNTQAIAILRPQRSVEAEFVIEIGDKARVPVVSPSTSPTLSPKESKYFIRSSWCSSYQAKAVAAIMKAFDWREVVLVYEDNSYGSGLVPFLAEEMLKSNVLMSNLSAVSPSAKNEELLQHLYQLKTLQTRVFLVHVLPALASRFFKAVAEAGMMSKGYSWIITDEPSSLLDSAFPKGSQLVADVSRAILKLKDDGKMARITRKWFEEGGCSGSDGATVNSKSLSADSFKGLFLVAGLSSSLALAICLSKFM